MAGLASQKIVPCAGPAPHRPCSLALALGIARKGKLNMFCPNRGCVDFLETGMQAEYRDDITVCPKCGAELVRELPAFLNAERESGGATAGAEIQAEILTELRRSRRLGMWVSLGMVGVLLLVVVRGELLRRRALTSPPAQAASVDSWHAVFDLVRSGRTDEALRMGVAAYSQAPEYYYSSLSLSHVYLVKGDLNHAVEYAERAYRLLPSEENEKFLAAVRKRQALESAMPPTKIETR